MLQVVFDNTYDGPRVRPSPLPRPPRNATVSGVY